MSPTTKKLYISTLMFVLVFVIGMTEECWGARASTTKALLPRFSNSASLSPDKRRTLAFDSLNSNVVDVTSFGAKGDGVTDDTEAFRAAWQSVCGKQSVTLQVPANYRFLVGPITFLGPCQSNIIFKVDGNLIAPVNARSWASNSLEWITFSKLNGITIVGKGLIDGQGAAWWKLSEYDDKESTQGGNSLPRIRPTAVRFYGSYDVSVQGIAIKNSPQCHLKFDSCTSVKVVGVTVSSPANSPNTDGIHLQNSRDVEIHDSSMAGGDDCVSVQGGCSGISFYNISCGPGHGVSIGGLGKDGTKACVSNVTVYNTRIHDTLFGVRIKTWQGGMGSVRSVSFSNIQVSNVRVPIDIDQFYCDGGSCSNKTSAVYISDVKYDTIKGTYLDTPLYLACSDDVPCTDLKLLNIHLEPAATYHKDPFCWNTYGHSETPSQPAVDCLLSGKPLKGPPRTQTGANAC